MKKLLALAVLFAACGAALAQSAGVMLYGPFSVTLPSPNTFAHSASFSVPPSAVGPYVMRVELSAPNSLTALSASLNGAQVIGLADFAGGATRVDRPVNVLVGNTAAVRVAGAKGTTITLSVFSLVMPKPVSLLPSPLELTAGRAAGTLTATLSPTPTAAGTLSLTSANPALASAPATVAFAAGQSAVPVPVSGIASGSTTITAAANGGQATASVNVNAPPSVSLTAPASNAIFTAPADITLTAQVSDADGTIAKVEYFQGSTLITTQTAPPYSFVWTAVPQGAYSLTAAATDDRGASTTSAAVTVTVNSAVAQLYYIHADHLNTPRLIADSTGTTVWRNDNTEPFGDSVADENPSGLGAFEFPLRDPGTYFDNETNLVYNWNRYRDLNIGRFIQADPLGLSGGDLSLYVLTANNPLSFIDPRGLAALCATDTPDRGKCEAKLALDLAVCVILEKGCDFSCSVLCRRAGPLRRQCMKDCMEDICDPVFAHCRRAAFADYAECKKRESGGS
jgi:RHS repeat-associated protein